MKYYKDNSFLLHFDLLLSSLTDLSSFLPQVHVAYSHFPSHWYGTCTPPRWLLNCFLFLTAWILPGTVFLLLSIVLTIAVYHHLANIISGHAKQLDLPWGISCTPVWLLFAIRCHILHFVFIMVRMHFWGVPVEKEMKGSACPMGLHCFISLYVLQKFKIAPSANLG